MIELWVTVAEYKALKQAVRMKLGHMNDDAARYRWAKETYPNQELLEVYQGLTDKFHMKL